MLMNVYAPRGGGEGSTNERGAMCGGLLGSLYLLKLVGSPRTAVSQRIWGCTLTVQSPAASSSPSAPSRRVEKKIWRRFGLYYIQTMEEMCTAWTPVFAESLEQSISLEKDHLQALTFLSECSVSMRLHASSARRQHAMRHADFRASLKTFFTVLAALRYPNKPLLSGSLESLSVSLKDL